jgi:hypothetical protein
MLPLHVQEFRNRYRTSQIGTRYSGVVHLLFTSLGSLAVIVTALAMLDRPSLLELLTVPVTFLYANWVEYIAHRGPMHHRTPGLGIIFQRHTEEHHRFFTHQASACESTRDFKMILFPPVMLLFVIGGFSVPVALALWHWVSPNVACLFEATAVAYFLNYEWFHLAYHQPESSWVSRIPGLRRMSAHHLRHHDPRLMLSHNFNITYPICDKLYGTLK